MIVLEQSDPVLRGQPPEKPAADEREVFNAFVTARMLRLAERFARKHARYTGRRSAGARLHELWRTRCGLVCCKCDTCFGVLRAPTQGVRAR